MEILLQIFTDWKTQFAYFPPIIYILTHSSIVWVASEYDVKLYRPVHVYYSHATSSNPSASIGQRGQWNSCPFNSCAHKYVTGYGIMSTACPLKYSNGFAVLCFVLFVSSDMFFHIFRGGFTEAIIPCIFPWLLSRRCLKYFNKFNPCFPCVSRVTYIFDRRWIFLVTMNKSSLNVYGMNMLIGWACDPKSG